MSKKENNMKNSLLASLRENISPEFNPVKKEDIFTTILDNSEEILQKYEGKQIEILPISKLLDAPLEWNPFPKHDDKKMFELIESILQKGLIHPLVVWKQKDETYMILSGHNRRTAFVLIYEAFNDSKFLNIPVIIYSEDELNSETAQDMIDDLNMIQREYNKSLIAKYVVRKYNRIKKDPTIKGRTRDEVSKRFEEIGITGRMIDYYLHIDKLIPELQQLIYENLISLKNSTKLKNLSLDLQKWFYDNYKDKIDNKAIAKFTKVMTKADIDAAFNKASELSIVQIEVPDFLKSDFLTMCKEWIEKNHHNIDSSNQN